MSGPTVMVSSWSDGLTIFRDGDVRREFAGAPTCGLARDGGVYVIVGGALYGSQNRGRSWSLRAQNLPAPSGVLIC